MCLGFFYFMSHPVLFCNLVFSCMPLSFTFTYCRFSCQFFCTTCFQPVIHSPKYIYSPISLCQMPDCLCTPSRQAFQGFPYDLFTRWYLLCLSEIFFPLLYFGSMFLIILCMTFACLLEFSFLFIYRAGLYQTDYFLFTSFLWQGNSSRFDTV